MDISYTQVIILNKFRKTNEIYLEDIAKELNVTNRFIRYKIEEINYFLKKNSVLGLKIEKKKIIYLDKKEKINFILNNIPNENYIFNVNERLKYLYIRLLFSLKLLKQEDLESELNCSISTIKTLFKSFKKEYPQMPLLSKSHYGTCFDYNEYQWRLKILEVLQQNYTISSDKEIIEIITTKMPYEKIINSVIENFLVNIKNKKIKIILENILKYLNISFSSEIYNIIYFYITITIIRINFGNNISTGKSIQDNIEELNFIQKFFNEHKIKIEIIEIFFIKKLLLSLSNEELSYINKPLWIDLEHYIYSFIKNIEQKYDRKLISNTEFYELILKQFIGIINRREHNLTANFIYVEEVKIKYKRLYTIIYDFLKTKISPFSNLIQLEDIALLTFYSQAVLEKYNERQIIIKNVMIVCHFGLGTSNILKYRLEKTFNINIVSIAPLHSLEKYLSKSIELIISTCDIKKNLLIPVLKISPLLEESEINKLSKYLNLKTIERVPLNAIIKVVEKNCIINNINILKNDLRKIMKISDFNTKYNLLDLLTKERIEIISSVKTWEDAIKRAGNLLEKSNCITKNYTEKMIEVIKINGPYMIIGDKTILPHARLKDEIFETGMSMVILKKPIIFGDGFKISVIVAFSSKNKSEHIYALNQFSTFIIDYALEDALEICENIDEVIEILKVNCNEEIEL